LEIDFHGIATKKKSIGANGRIDNLLNKEKFPITRA
jgi:hypothetical protein